MHEFFERLIHTDAEPVTPSGEVLYPRQCVKCGSGMQEGYLSEDGDTLCSDACFFSDGYTKEEYQRDYERGTCFWTEWEWDNGWSEQWTKDGTRYTLCDDGYTWEKKMTKYNVGRIQSFKEYLIVEAFSRDEAFDMLRDAMDAGADLKHVYLEGDGELVCEEIQEA